MSTLIAYLALDVQSPGPTQSVPPPLLIGDIMTARAGVPELLIQIARSQNREDPPPSL
jgi:hypothetical protein